MGEVQAKRETVVITKRGKPVAKLVPINTDQDEIFGFLAGKGTVIGDVISPALTPEDWDLADGLAVSDMTLLEVGRLVSRGRIRLSISLESFPAGNRGPLCRLPNNRPCVCARWHFEQRIPKIRQIASQEPPRSSKGCP